MARNFYRQLHPICESNKTPLDKIQQLVEGDTKAAFDMEKVIVSAAGGPKFVSELIPDSEEVGKKIASKLGISNDGGRMPANSYPASKEWAEYFKPGKPSGSTLTPKTDIIIGKKRVSVKTGNAVLMSGEKKEATATSVSYTHLTLPTKRIV